MILYNKANVFIFFKEAVVLVAAKKNANPADIEDYIVVVAGEGKRYLNVKTVFLNIIVL
jgi:hypothetical protein